MVYDKQFNIVLLLTHGVLWKIVQLVVIIGVTTLLTVADPTILFYHFFILF
jgi:hypothetical protein